VSAPLSGKVAWSSKGVVRKRAATWSFCESARWSGIAQQKKAVAPLSSEARQKRVPTSLSGEATRSFDKARRKRAPAPSSRGA